MRRGRQSIGLGKESMRRKVLQHFANTPPQRLLDLPSGFDLARFVRLAAGSLEVDFLSGECRHNGDPIPPFDMCAEHRSWMDQAMQRHHIPKEALVRVAMNLDFVVSDLEVKQSFGNVFRSATFSFDCHSEVQTDQKTYVSHQKGEKLWGYDYYWEKLYATVEPQTA